jgi:hypothetical protein
LALLAGALLKAIAAASDPLPMGPWDVKPVASAGRLANHLALHVDLAFPNLPSGPGGGRTPGAGACPGCQTSGAGSLIYGRLKYSLFLQLVVEIAREMD